jgi:hypothetical protein
VVEFHHVAGRANDPELGVFLCLTHHRKLTEQMRDEGFNLRHDEKRTELQRLEAVLRGTALFEELHAAACRRWAEIVSAMRFDPRSEEDDVG